MPYYGQYTYIVHQPKTLVYIHIILYYIFRWTVQLLQGCLGTPVAQGIPHHIPQKYFRTDQKEGKRKLSNFVGVITGQDRSSI